MKTMKRLLPQIIALFMTLLAFSCVQEEAPENVSRPVVDYEGQEVLVHFDVEMPEPQTKTLGENPSITSLHVAVFGSSGYLKEYKLAQPVDGYVSAEGVANKKGYTVSLSITSSKVRVHLIANGPESLDFDYESVVMSKLASSNNNGAYWQRIILDHGIYADQDAPGYYDIPPVLTLDPDFDLDTDGTTHKMALIQLIRNYAKISVVADPVAQSNFTVTSFCVVNVPDRGSIAPYNKSDGEFVMNYGSYATLDALSAVYPGNLPAGAAIVKTLPTETDFTNLTNGVVAAGSAVYMYERPVPVSDATVLIVKGTYKDPNTGTNYPGYYKIDMMDGGQYLPILRNFRYQINIQRVNRKGKSTVSGAYNGAGSADISADISTASQTGISDGKSSIAVSFTEETLAIGGTYTLGVTFVPDVATGTVRNDMVTYELLSPDANGAVIESEDDISYNSSTGTLTFTTTDVDPLHIKSQKIRVIGTSSTSRLYREVTIRLLPQQTMTVTCTPVIEAEPGTPQTLTVSIPKDLPQSIFPLQFKVEVAEKTLTPNANDLPVEPGVTIVSGRSGNSFQFVKTISYSAYTAAYSGNVSIFTCEFKSIIADSSSDVYVANPYFATASTSFSTFVKRYFSRLAFSTAGAVNEDDPVTFSFVMDAEHETGKLIPETVDVYLTGLIPDYDNPNWNSEVFQNVSGNHYVYDVPSPGTGTQHFYLLSTGETPNYKVALSAQYYEDNEKTNVPMSFTGLSFNSTVLYGVGWPATFQFTIPTTYEMPAVGYIDIELNLTNLAPNDQNITESGGKYYYRATSTGTKTINLKTAGSQTASVSVELIHGDFIPSSATQTTRTYLNIAAGKITNSVPGATRPFRQNRNTVYVFTNKNATGQVSSYTTNTDNTATTRTNYSAANFASNVVDADQHLYLRMRSEYNSTTYWATTTAATLYNNGGNSTVTFSTNAPGTKQVTINTTNSNFSTSNRTYTTDDVTVTFSNLTNVNNGYVTMGNSSRLTVSATSGYHITGIAFTYTSSGWITTTYYVPSSVSASTGTYSGSNNNVNASWTPANNTTNSVYFTVTRGNNDMRIASVVVSLAED